MNHNLETFLHHISIVLHSEMTIEEDHAWIVPAENPELLLTLVWGDENEDIIYSLSLGEFNEHLPHKLALDCLQTNLLMATKQGPRLTYSSESKMITLVDAINFNNTTEDTLGNFTLEFVKFGAEIRNKIEEIGYRINITMDN